jgi:hypothetical protein
MDGGRQKIEVQTQEEMGLGVERLAGREGREEIVK